jgi:integrase
MEARQMAHLTDAAISAIKPPVSGQAFYRHDDPRGLAVRVTGGGTKSYILETLVGKKVRRITIGRCDVLPLRRAALIARKLLGGIAEGKDPVASKRQVKLAGVTLMEVFTAYIEGRKLAPHTLRDYGQVINTAFADWRGRPLANVGREAVARRFAKLRDDNGGAYANLAMRLLRALFNFAAGKYADDGGQSPFMPNPVKILSETRSWVRVDRRRTVIKPHELAGWHNAVLALRDDTARDYLRLLLFMGLRRSEAAGLRWIDIDFSGRTLTVATTKNGKPHTLPMPGYILRMLASRWEGRGESPFVFPGDGASKHIEDPRAACHSVYEASGVSFTLHDLRRTFATIAESLDIPSYALKHLLNHASGDVTGGYIVLNVERLRAPMTKIAAFIESACGISDNAVIPFTANL